MRGGHCRRRPEQAQAHLTTPTTMYREGHDVLAGAGGGGDEGAALDALSPVPLLEPRPDPPLRGMRREAPRGVPGRGRRDSSWPEILRELRPASGPWRRPWNEVSFTRELHPEASRREDPHLKSRPRGRTQASHGPVRRPEGLDEL